VNDLLARLRSALDDLEPRERLLVIGAGTTLAVFLVVLGIVNPLLGASSRASGRVIAAEGELQAVQRLRSEYEEVNARLARVEERVRSGPDSIFTTLEKLAEQSAVKVNAMEPRTAPASDDFQETRVQVSLKGVTISQVVTYLHRIEEAEQLLSIKSLRIRSRGDKQGGLDVTFSVSSFEPV